MILQKYLHLYFYDLQYKYNKDYIYIVRALEVD